MPAFRPTLGLSLVGCALSAGMLLSASAFAQPVLRQQAAVDPLVRLNESMDALTKKVWPSVVQIQVTSYGPREQSSRDDTSVVVGRQRSVGAPTPSPF